MGYGYKRVSSRQLMGIVDRLTVPTRASISWRHDYDAQGENLKFLKSHDPDIHPIRSCTPEQLDAIIGRLTRPTTASIAAVWNFDNQDANLAYLRRHDGRIELPYKTASPGAASTPSRRRCINVEDFVPTCRSLSAHRREASAARQHHVVSYGNELATDGRKTMTSSTLPQLLLQADGRPKPCRHLTKNAYQYMVNYDM